MHCFAWFCFYILFTIYYSSYLVYLCIFFILEDFSVYFCILFHRCAFHLHLHLHFKLFFKYHIYGHIAKFQLEVSLGKMTWFQSDLFFNNTVGIVLSSLRLVAWSTSVQLQLSSFHFLSSPLCQGSQPAWNGHPVKS